MQDLCIFSSFRLLGEVLASSASTVITQFTVYVQNAHNTSCHWTNRHNNERGLVIEGLNDLLWGLTNFITVFITSPAGANTELSKKKKTKQNPIGLNLVISEKKSRGIETGIQKSREKRLYHLLKPQRLGLFPLYPLP